MRHNQVKAIKEYLINVIIDPSCDSSYIFTIKGCGICIDGYQIVIEVYIGIVMNHIILPYIGHNTQFIRYNFSYYGDVIHSAPGLSYAQTLAKKH